MFSMRNLLVLQHHYLIKSRIKLYLVYRVVRSREIYVLLCTFCMLRVIIKNLVCKPGACFDWFPVSCEPHEKKKKRKKKILRISLKTLFIYFVLFI